MNLAALISALRGGSLTREEVIRRVAYSTWQRVRRYGISRIVLS